MNFFKTVSPESAWISPEILLRMMQKLNELRYVNSIMVQRHGCSILDAWQEPYRR